MAKQDSSALAAAAAAFDAELAAYARLGKLFLETPLSSVKHLERSNQTLSEIAACEERLQAAGKALVIALSGARQQQEDLAKEVVAHVPNLQARNQRLQQLMGELGSLAGEVSGLNQVISSRSENGDSTQGPTAADALDVSAMVLGLSDRAEQLARTAREAELEELHTQAHALHQRLQAIGKKLQKAGSS
jgi:septal ring factor EnvC (AmiA/AmiB activator)